MTDSERLHHDDPEVVDDGTARGASVTRHEEQAHTGVEQHESGQVRVRKHVDSRLVEEVVPRRVEHGDLGERSPATEGDSGEVEVLEDGSVSIPIFEEELVVTKRLVVRERVIVRKRTVIDEHRLQTELRRERVEVEGDIDLDENDASAGEHTRPTTAGKEAPQQP